ncbi:hypothetical protein GCM10027418_21020 [Mariniluteicoccus endophyticus]
MKPTAQVSATDPITDQTTGTVMPARAGATADPSARPRRLWPLVAVLAVMGGLLSMLLGPGPGDPGPWRGDPALVSEVERAFAGTPGMRSAEVVRLDGPADRRVRLGEPGRHHELGSITKTFNGMVLADAVGRGEVRLDDPVAKHLPELAGSPVGGVTLHELAQHRGGVPELLPAEAVGGIAGAVSLRNPYHLTTAQVLQQSRDIKLTRRGERRYSNLGAALLGHALTRATHHPDWPTMLRVRLLQPLGMNDTVIATRPDLVPTDASRVTAANGVTAEHWVADGMAPAGTSTFTTADDLTRYARAVLDGTAPGMAAVEPTFQASERMAVGLHWVTSRTDHGTVTWHNGSTTGSRTFLGLDRANGRAVVVFNDSGIDVDDAAKSLLLGAPAKPSSLPVVGIGLLLFTALAIGYQVWRLRDKSPSRVALAAAVLEGGALLALLHQVGPWERVPGLVWGGLVGVVVALAAIAVTTWGNRPTTGRKRVTEVANLAVSVLFAAIAAYVLLAG